MVRRRVKAEPDVVPSRDAPMPPTREKPSRRRESRRSGRGERGSLKKARNKRSRTDDSREPTTSKRSGSRKKKKGDSRRTRGGREGRARDARRTSDRRREGARGRDRHRRRDAFDGKAIDIVPRAPSPEDQQLEKVLLVNAADREEARIALVVGGRLEEIYVESTRDRSTAGHIYRGRIQNVEKGIGAAFVDLGRGVTGFLHVSDMPVIRDDDTGATTKDNSQGTTDSDAQEANPTEQDAPSRSEANEPPEPSEPLALHEPLRAGDEVIVQITRDGIGRKGPALTGRISLPGRYLVLLPYAGRSGISRRIPQGRERQRMRKLLRKLDVPGGMGVIVRTASESTDLAALQADLAHLVDEWSRIQERAAEPGPPGVLRAESNLAERSVRDIMPSDVTRIVVDRGETAGQMHRLLRTWYPSAAAAAEEVSKVAARTVSASAFTPLGELSPTGEALATSVGAAPDATEDETLSEVEGEWEEESHPGANGLEPIELKDDERVADEWDDSELVDDDDDHHEDLDDDDDEDHDVDEYDEDVDDDEDEEDLEDDDDDDHDHEDEDDHVAESEESPSLQSAPDGEVEDEELEDAVQIDVESEVASNEEDEEDPAARIERLRALARSMPDVEIHTDPMPLFHAYNIETQLEEAFRRTVRLPSGGSLVFDPTEALFAIDVNSGRLTDAEDPERTALVTNLEAVAEVARQLRLRDRGGLVVIDFIDMRMRSSRRKVEVALREALSKDRARIRLGRMGPFGLVILSRQRIRQALSRVTHTSCTACHGTGRRRHVSGLGLRILREMEARVARARGRGGLEVRAPQEVLQWLKKHRAGALRALRAEARGPLELVSDSRLAVDGWAMKGIANTEPSGKPDKT